MGDKLKEKPECLTPMVKGSGASVILWGEFCWYGLGPLVPLEGTVTADQYKVVLSYHLYLMMKHLYLNTLLKHYMLVFPLICHPSVCKYT